jgi:hypothetical protein
MNDHVDVSEGIADCLVISDVTVDELNVGVVTQCLLGRIVSPFQIVENSDIVVIIGDTSRQMGTDESGTASNQHISHR